jgi:hypothetical protein
MGQISLSSFCADLSQVFCHSDEKLTNTP